MPQASLKIDILLPHLFFARLFFMKIQHGCLDSTLVKNVKIGLG